MTDTFTIRASIDTDSTYGMNVTDWFDTAEVFERRFTSEAEAEAFARAHYRGPDVDGVGVTFWAERA